MKLFSATFHASMAKFTKWEKFSYWDDLAIDETSQRDRMKVFELEQKCIPFVSANRNPVYPTSFNYDCEKTKTKVKFLWLSLPLLVVVTNTMTDGYKSQAACVFFFLLETNL